MPAYDPILYRAIKRFFSSTILARGEQLLSRGCVGEIRHYQIDDGLDEFEAEVVGSTGNDYQVEVNLYRDTLEAECDCAYDGNCKHAAALLLAIAEQKAIEAKVQPVTPVANKLDTWLNGLKISRNIARPGGAMATAQQDWYAFYLIDTRNPAKPMLVPVMRFRKKNGDWGRLESLPNYKVRHFQGQNRHDKAAWSLMGILPTRGQRLASQQFFEGYTLEGDSGYLLLQHALSSGHALDLQSFEPLALGENLPLTLDWVSVDGGQLLEPYLDAAPEGDWQRLATSPPSYRIGNTIGTLDTPVDADTLTQLLAMPPIPEAQFQSVCAQLAHLLGDKAIPLPEGVSSVETVADFIPKATLLGVYSPVNGYLPALRLSAVYGDWEQALDYLAVRRQSGLPDMDALMEVDGRLLNITRRYGREYALMEQLRARQLIPYDYQGEAGELWVPSEIQPVRHLAAWHKNLPALQQLFEAQGWLVEVDASYQTRSHSIRVSAEASNYNNGWFDLGLTLDLGGIQLDSAAVISQWLAAGTPPVLPLKDQDQQWTMVDMAPLQPVLNILLELYGAGSLNKPARLPAFKVMELDGLEGANFKQPPSLKKLRQALQNFSGLNDVVPDKKLQAELRDYQVQGLSWLMFLRNYGFGGILADDMGLGKTLQTLAFIQKLKATRKLTKGALVIAPTSLIWNWLAEAQKFTPNLKCLMLHGTERKTRFDEIPGHDLIITSYGLIQRDIEVYQDYHFDLVILDEAQNIKNTQAKTTAMVRQLPSDMRLCLTGTPLENHLGELWSLMDFALPGLLGAKDHFRRHFRTEIELNGNAERSRQLSQRVAPFMLRRTKAQVVHELPQKTEILQRVDLAKDQKALYESIRIGMEKRVRELIKQKGVARSHIEFLDALLKLRQACIDPRLVKLEQVKKSISSAKMQWLVETLPELVEEGRKILIFSQFTQMLELIEAELALLKIPTTKLTGRTRNRQAVIENFQQGDVPIFLVSLKAGGSGLNLTAADTVIHVDPWWNPAVENQATDRAYRIGQDKPVFVYKLVANGTVEEKIQALQQQKQSLADALFDETAKAGLPKSGDELLALFGS